MFEEDNEDMTKQCHCGGTVAVTKISTQDPQGMEPLRLAVCQSCKQEGHAALSPEGALTNYKHRWRKTK